MSEGYAIEKFDAPPKQQLPITRKLTEEIRQKQQQGNQHQFKTKNNSTNETMDSLGVHKVHAIYDHAHGRGDFAHVVVEARVCHNSNGTRVLGRDHTASSFI